MACRNSCGFLEPPKYFYLYLQAFLVKHAIDVGNNKLFDQGAYLKTNRRNNGTLHTLTNHPPSADSGSCTAVGNLLLTMGLFEGATLKLKLPAFARTRPLLFSRNGLSNLLNKIE